MSHTVADMNICINPHQEERTYLEPGAILSHYRLLEKIAEGGMGVVWKAEDNVLGRTVAMKLLPTDLSRDHDRRLAFLNEARLASQVSNPHCVQVYEFNREGDLDFIVMEYVEGEPLNKILNGHALPPEKVAVIGHQLARALSVAHRKGLLHRDLKPSNILVTSQDEVKVADFGLATLLEPRNPMSASSDTTGGVERGEFVGTLHYMSPEQATGSNLDPRSDIFSLGVVLYEMTTGRRPFLGGTSGEVLTGILRGETTRVQHLVPKVPLDLDRIVHKALATHRADRYQTMDDLAVDLNRLAKDLESGSSPSYEELTTVRETLGQQTAARIVAGVVVALLALLTLLGASQALVGM
jgi:eukaryotic-like serine/threonine-protein kinase